MSMPLALLLCASGGLLLYAADHPLRLRPLVWLAFVPWVVGVDLTLSGQPGLAAWGGLCMGAAFILPLLLHLGFPFLLSVVLGTYLTLWWVLLSIGAAWLWSRQSATMGALCVAAWTVVLERLNVSVFPMWGTAQSFVRSTTGCPSQVRFVRLTGPSGVVFVVVGLQALAVAFVTHPAERVVTGTAFCVLITLVILGNVILNPGRPVGTVRVAAVGWTPGDFGYAAPLDSHTLFAEHYVPLVRAAAGDGARLVASPETGFSIAGNARDLWLSRISEVARCYRVWLVVGYFDEASASNRMVFYDPEGELKGEYTKTHLILFIESYRKGNGVPLHLSIEGHRAGAMICQDDNFTDLARAYGRTGVQLVIVPTNDWHAVRHYHFENSIMRALDSGYGIVRAASSGISAIVSAKGDILASADHFVAGACPIVADLPIYNTRGRFFAHLGDWPSWCALAFLAWAVYRTLGHG